MIHGLCTERRWWISQATSITSSARLFPSVFPFTIFIVTFLGAGTSGAATGGIEWSFSITIPLFHGVILSLTGTNGSEMSATLYGNGMALEITACVARWNIR